MWDSVIRLIGSKDPLDKDTMHKRWTSPENSLVFAGRPGIILRPVAL